MERGNAGGETPENEDAASADAAAEAALDWFARLRDADVDARTRAAFESWLAADPRHRREYEALEALWGSREFAVAAATVPAGEVRVEVGARANARSRGGARVWPRRAAALAAVVLIAVGAHQYPTLRAQALADVTTSTGEQETVTLPDGSVMMLNTGSAAAFDFEDGRRDVTLLAGEAFFDVRHDAAHPFRVIGGYGEVTVLGTAFTVRAASSEDRVILERGRVEVALLSDARRREALAPNEMVAAAAAVLSPVATVDPRRALAWREGRIVFSGAPLSTVLDELGRYYGGVIYLADGEAGALEVSGNYRIDDVEAAVRTLADVAGLTLTRLPLGVLILS